MQKINFQDLPSTTTPINASNLNQVQTNVEDAINDISTYSTTEQRIGTWINGKPLYKRTIYSTTISGSLGLSNVDFLRWKNFNAFVNNEILFPDARYTSSSDKLDFFVNKTQNSFTLSLGSAWESKFTYLVFDIEYTKTTD